MLIACTHTHTLPREACACASAAQSAMGPKAPKESKEIPESVKKFCRLYCKLYLKKYDPPVNHTAGHAPARGEARVRGPLREAFCPNPAAVVLCLVFILPLHIYTHSHCPRIVGVRSNNCNARPCVAPSSSPRT